MKKTVTWILRILKNFFKVKNNSSRNDDAEIKKLMVQINNIRKQNNHQPVVTNLKCMEAAYKVAESMFRYNYVTTKMHGIDVRHHLLINGVSPDFIFVYSVKSTGNYLEVFSKLTQDPKSSSNLYNKDFCWIGVCKFDVYWAVIFAGNKYGQEI